MKAVIYCRTSTDEQADSCANQERVGREKAKELGATVVDVYTDEGISGSDNSRPAFQRMMADANVKVFDALLIWKLDRLGRDAPIRELAMRRLENIHGVRIITSDNYDTSKDSAKNRKMMRGFKGIVNEMYIDNLSEDVHRGQKDKFLEGYWVGGRVYGYKLEPVLSAHERDPYGNPKQTATLIKIDPVQAKIVNEIFARFAKGASPQAIAADLNKRNVPSPGSTWKREVRRCYGWARSAIRAMIQNPIYSGVLYWNRSQWIKREAELNPDVRRPKSRRLRKERGKAEFHRLDAPHLRIVTDAAWKLSQLRLNANKVKPDDKRLLSGGKAIYMLSGLLRCQCGAHFVLDSATHYRCGKDHDGRACTKSQSLRVRRDIAEQIILKPIVDELLAPSVVDEMVKEMRTYYAQRMADAKTEKAKAPAEVQELDERITRLRTRLKAGDPDMAADDIMAVIEKVEARRAELLSVQPEAKHHAKLLRALPAAAKQYRDQITKGFGGNVIEAGRARVAVRQLLGGYIILRPAKDRSHLVAHMQFQRAALLGVGAAQQLP
jgi:DNA invertase Pin-like site-specific DNA recombinase